jgi:hypothetical protein
MTTRMDYHADAGTVYTWPVVHSHNGRTASPIGLLPLVLCLCCMSSYERRISCTAGRNIQNNSKDVRIISQAIGRKLGRFD